MTMILSRNKTILLSMLIVSCILAIYVVLNRLPPSSLCSPLFQGVTYFKEVRSAPRPLVLHGITADLTNQHLAFLVTPGEKSPQGEIMAQTTQSFIKKFNLQVAINGSFFFPFHSNSPWDYFPHEGDPVNVIGFASSRGQIYSEREERFNTLYISADHQVSFTKPSVPIVHAISGREFLLLQGKIPWSLDREHTNPRTAIALNQASTVLILIVVDGRQPGYSEGVTLFELAKIIRSYGGYTALNLDGGGSSTLVIADKLGKPTVLNSPIHTRIPGRERPIANHLGIYARFLSE